MAILKGKKVNVEIKGETKIGTVRESYISRNNETVFIIELEGGEFIKASERNVQEYKEPEPVKRDDEITVNHDHFRSIVAEVTYDLVGAKFEVGSFLCLFGTMLWSRLAEETKDE